MKRKWTIGLALCALLAASTASAQTDYPSRVVRVVVPFAAGGGTDVLTRLIAEQLSRALDKQFYIENAPGAGGTTATAQVARKRSSRRQRRTHGSRPMRRERLTSGSCCGTHGAASRSTP